MDSQKIQVHIHHGGHFKHKVYVPKLCDPLEVLKEVLESVRREGEGQGLLTYKELERNILVEASAEQVTGEEGAKKKLRFKSPAKKRSKRPKKIVINTPSENPKTTNVFSSYQLRSGRQLNKDVGGSKKRISLTSKNKGKERIGESKGLSESEGVDESQGAGITMLTGYNYANRMRRRFTISQLGTPRHVFLTELTMRDSINPRTYKVKDHGMTK